MFPASYGLSGPDVQEFHVSEDSTVSLSTVWSNLPCPTTFRYASACAKWFFPPHSCGSTAASKAWKQQWQLYHTHHLWPIVSKVTVMLSSGLVAIIMPHEFFPSLSLDCVTATSENVPGSNPVPTLPTWLSDLLPCISTHVTVWLCSVVQSLSPSGPWRVVSWHLTIWVPLLFCFTITVWVESDVQCRTGKRAVYFTYRCYPVICLEALKATTMKPQNTLCQG